MSRAGLMYRPEEPAIREWFKYAELAEERGYESIWVAEHYYFRDAFSPIAAFALRTNKIRLATSVINPYTRNPALIAMTIATVDELSNGRAILGIGAGMFYHIEEEMGIKMEKPLTAIKECVKIIRELLAGRTVTYQGEIFNARRVKLGFKPVREYVPIYIGAVGPRMLQLAGEIGDGVLLTLGSSPEYTRYAVESVKRSAKRAGRDPAKVDVASVLLLSVSEDSEAAKQATREIVAFYLSIPGRGEMMLSRNILETDQLSLLREAWQRCNMRDVLNYVSDDMIESITVSGTPIECRKKLREYKSAGVNLPIYFIPAGQNVQTTIELIGQP